MTKLLIGLLAAGVLATGGLAAASGLDDTEPARTVSIPAATCPGHATRPSTRTTARPITTRRSGSIARGRHGRSRS